MLAMAEGQLSFSFYNCVLFLRTAWSEAVERAKTEILMPMPLGYWISLVLHNDASASDSYDLRISCTESGGDVLRRPEPVSGVQSMHQAVMN
jgi:hypothetical protein